MVAAMLTTGALVVGIASARPSPESTSRSPEPHKIDKEPHHTADGIAASRAVGATALHDWTLRGSSLRHERNLFAFRRDADALKVHAPPPPRMPAAKPPARDADEREPVLRLIGIAADSPTESSGASGIITSTDGLLIVKRGDVIAGR